MVAKTASCWAARMVDMWVALRAAHSAWQMAAQMAVKKVSNSVDKLETHSAASKEELKVVHWAESLVCHWAGQRVASKDVY